jgi:hypothetical protein
MESFEPNYYLDENMNDIINFEAPNVKKFYESNVKNLIENTP